MSTVLVHAVMQGSQKMTHPQRAASLQEAEEVMQKLQCSALASCTPSAKARAPLLAAVHLEWRKHTSGLACGPGISSEHLTDVSIAFTPQTLANVLGYSLHMHIQEVSGPHMGAILASHGCLAGIGREGTPGVRQSCRALRPGQCCRGGLQ